MWKRLQDEGAQIRVWRGTEKGGSPALLTSHRRVGEGIVPLVDSWYDLLGWCKMGQAIGEPTMMLFDSSGLGALADDARDRGIYVFGGGRFCDRLEKDRSFGRNLAERCGIMSPPVQEFSSIIECLAYARETPSLPPVYWKTDSYVDGDATHGCEDAGELIDYLTWIQTRCNPHISCILEKKLDGVPLSTARYWNGRAWVGPYEATIERKKFLTGELGSSTGCSLNGIGFWDDDDPEIADALHWNALTTEFLKHDAPPCLYDINAIVNDGKAYMLEWTPRMGWDSEGTSHLLFPDYSAWLWYVTTGQGFPEGPRDEVAVAIRLSVLPAPWEHGERDEKGSCVGVPIRGETGDLWSGGFMAYELMENEHGLAVAAPEGIVGLSAQTGESASELAERVTDFAKDELWAASPLQFRIDAGDAIAEDAEKITAAGFSLPAGLLG